MGGLLSRFRRLPFSYFIIGLEVPEERVHFIQYGLLALLIIYSLNPWLSGVKLYLLSGLMASLFGIIDEIIQYFLPSRYFDIRDISFNISASLMGVLLYGLLKTYIIKEDAGQPSISEDSF